MIRNKSIACIVPCFNEENGLRELLPTIPNFVDEVVVVDNNSTDETVAVAKSFSCTTLHEDKQGYGATYKCGFKYVTRDIIVTMDGDNTYPLDEIKKNITMLLENDVDFISCSRFPLKNTEIMDFSNFLGNKILTLVASILFGKLLRDSQSGMWIFKKHIFNFIMPNSNGMALSQEIKLLALLHPLLKFKEVRINYRPRVGEVKLKKWRDGFKNLKQLLFMTLKKW